jgi:hypothetical protein
VTPRKIGTDEFILQHGRITSIRPWTTSAQGDVIVKTESGGRYVARVVPPHEQLRLFDEGRGDPIPCGSYTARPPSVPSDVIEPLPRNAFRGGGLPQGWRIIGIGGRGYIQRPATESDPPDRRVQWADTEAEAIARMRRKYAAMAFSHEVLERHIERGGTIEDY